MTQRPITLIDTTLADGSLGNGFSFTADDTVRHVRALERAGVGEILTGHGLGLGAHSSGHAPAAEPDQRYMAAARGAARQTRVGVRANPEFASPDDIEAAVRAGMDFVRIEIEASRVSAAQTLVHKALESNLEAHLVLLNSKSAAPKILRELAREITGSGLTSITVSDCTGSMIPAQVKSLVRALTDNCDVPVGFRGQNTFQLAVGNAFAALEAGATRFDGTLSGVGAHAGQAPLESLAYALTQAGFDTGCDLASLSGMATDFVGPTPVRSTDQLATAAGGLSQSMIESLKIVSSDFDMDVAELSRLTAETVGEAELDISALRALAQIEIWSQQDLELAPTTMGRA